ncbi:hypothetical protein V2G26_007198 [Clonostachys chloroleuca]
MCSNRNQLPRCTQPLFEIEPENTGDLGVEDGQVEAGDTGDGDAGVDGAEGGLTEGSECDGSGAGDAGVESGGTRATTDPDGVRACGQKRNSRPSTRGANNQIRKRNKTSKSSSDGPKASFM